MKARTVLVCPDTHVAPQGSIEGGIDPKAESVLMQAIDIVKPDEFVHLGDVGEWEAVCDYRWERRRRPPFEFLEPLVRADISAVNVWLDKIEKKLDKVGCSKVRIVEGNHEVWMDNFAEQETRPEFGAKGVMQLDKRGWQWTKHGDFAKVGRLHVTHGGHFTGQHHSYKTVVGLGVSCIYGHFHATESSHIIHLGGALGAWCAGCLCKMDKKFLKGKPTAWSHAFAVVHVESDGNFLVEIVNIYDGLAYIYGKKVEAK